MLAPYRSRGLIPYAIGLISVIIAWALRLVLDPVLGDHASFSFFFLAVSLTAWIGGIWPAVFTAILGCLLGNYYFTHPEGSLHISGHEEVFTLLIFIIVSLIIGILSETSLRALQRAKLAEQAKDAFMATLAHELRSPLSVIQYANELHRLSGSEQKRDQVDLIQRQVQHLDLMIQDLLDVSRVARGKIRLDRQQIDASSVVNGAVEKAKPLVASRRHTLAIHVAPEPMPLYGDPVRLAQALANLLTNAAKYTPDGGKIDVRVQPGGDSAVFTVRDNGIGIPQEILPRVFDLFMQADPTSASSEAGLGIGLALVQKIVELHGGSVHASSAGKNRGSEFTVCLPLEQPARAPRKLVKA
jgi:signal transduction histidine kinase